MAFDSHEPMKTNSTLQKLVDRGGTVRIPAGTYWMHDALHLRSGTRLIGEPGTILKKVPSVTSDIVPWIGFGQYEFAVKEPKKFKPGMGVIIADKNAFGFYETAATIIGRNGDQFYIDRPLAHDYAGQNGGHVTSVYPLISCRNANDVSIRNLILDGNHPKETRSINGCRGGGVFLQYSNRVEISGVEVRHLCGDAISFQQSTDVRIHDCHLHHNTGGGLHPGSGTVRYVMAHNCIEHNGGCGIFYCLRTKYSICEDNLIQHNDRAGISIGERDTDHLVRNNIVHGDIVFREPAWESGDRVWLEGNIIDNVILERDIHQVCLTGNTMKNLQVGPGCTDIFVADNPCKVTGKVKRGFPKKFPAIGPAAAPLDAARHLNVERLPNWKN